MRTFRSYTEEALRFFIVLRTLLFGQTQVKFMGHAVRTLRT